MDAALEYVREKALECPGCGLPRDETMDPQAEGRYRARALRCFACRAKDQEAKRFPPDSMGGLLFSAERET